jgi:hypothetical protein
VAEFFVPGAAGTKVAKAGKLAKAVKGAAQAGGVRAAQTGGDPAQTALAAAGGVALPPVGRGVKAAAGPVARTVSALTRTGTSPAGIGALVNAIPDLSRGDYKSAAVDAALAYFGIKGAQKIPAAFRLAKALRSGTPAAAMTKAEATAHLDALRSAGKVDEHRAFIEAIRAKTIKLVDSPTALAPVPPEPIQPVLEPPTAPQRPSGPLPEPGNVKPATIYQPEGTSFTMKRPEGRAAEAADKLTPENLSLAEKQQALIGENVDNPLIDPRARPTKAVPIPDKGNAAVLAHGEVMSAAKAAVKADPTYGDKVWLALDDSGKPAGTFKSEPAARAEAKKIGGSTTWAKNLWSKDFN